MGNSCICRISVVVVLLATSGNAWAAPTAKLIYVRAPGAESCPDENALRAAVAARLGYAPFFSKAPVTLSVEMARTSSGFRSGVKLLDANNEVRGFRDLEHAAADCAATIDMVALSVSIALDPQSMIARPSEAERNRRAVPSRFASSLVTRSVQRGLSRRPALPKWGVQVFRASD